ncbi:WhiB family transcriptional regulator [Egicoccus sp. AB-alg6-2]|uniref:WhiB family transcriptional regulator n=1 Tax=Egicoccus sp. AB-alg6-2 TaxID=3242692 RepID=UPI00359DAC54
MGATTIYVSKEWEERASCRSEDPALFFGPAGFESKHDRLQRESAAKAVCSVCPAMAACREYAVVTGEAYGVWGGLGETDRRALIASRGPRPAAHAV